MRTSYDQITVTQPLHNRYIKMTITPKTNSNTLFVTPAFAKILQELGVMQRSFSYWVKMKSGDIILIDSRLMDMMKQDFDPEHTPASAFTADELIRMLGSVACYLQMEDGKYIHLVHYKDPYDGEMITSKATYLQDALAATLIRLLSQKRKSVTEANEWLIAIE